MHKDSVQRAAKEETLPYPSMLMAVLDTGEINGQGEDEVIGIWISSEGSCSYCLSLK